MSKTPKNDLQDIEKNLSSSNTSSLIEEIPLLEELSDKTKFLRKTGQVFFYYTLICCIVTILIFFDLRKAREISRIFYLHKLVWVFLSFSLLTKFSVSFLPNFKNFQRFFFTFDLFLTFFVIIGLYFFLEEYQRQYSIAHGFYLILTIWVLFTTNIVFLLSTIIKSRRIYNPIYGIVAMTIISFVTLIILGNVWDDSLEGYKYFYIVLPVFFWNIFFCLNAFMIVNYRTRKFNLEDQYYCFFCIWTDILFVFWKDMIMNMKFVKKITKKKKKQKERKERE